MKREHGGDHGTPTSVRCGGPPRATEAKQYKPFLSASVSQWPVAVCILAACMLHSTTAHAQEFRLRGFGDAGATTFTAKESFRAILGSETGPVFGGGVEAVDRNFFLNVRASRFRETGQRVFLFEGEQFDLGIPTTITLTPVELTFGYRLPFWTRLVPYAGGGVGWHGFEETSEFAAAEENVEDRFTGYHVLGGAEVRLARWMGVAGELQWTTVPDAIGGDPNSVSNAFSESDLGGTTFRVKIIVGM
jgi:opacity protein-like surface antigen